ncbi:MAG: WG repeat-containing protein [Candidatus Fibromonas sp.]|nr:WG repeat-containing protein [Candidatus Fibromonas sp.]
MKKIILALSVAISVLLFACGNKTEADFSIVPVKGFNGEYQYIDIDQKGKIVINPQFGKATIFRDGLALVKTSGKDGKWGYIDKKGKFVIAPVYSKAQIFSNGVAWVQMEDQPPMLIDKNGKMLLQIDSLISAAPFSDGITRISVYSNGEELDRFINKKGELAVVTVIGEEIDDISEGLYLFKNKENGKWGYRNKNGESAITPQFDDYNLFIDGMAMVGIGNKWGVIDKKGNYLINPQYDELSYDSDGLFYVKVGKKYGWVNKKGEMIINPQFDDVDEFNGGELAPVQIGSKWAYIDKKGQIIINPQFELASPFNGDYAMIMNKDGKIGFIDKKGDFIVHPLYDFDLDDFYEYSHAYFIVQNLSFGDDPLTYYDRDFLAYERLREKRKEWAEEKTKEREREKENEKEKAAEETFTDSRDGKTYKIAKIGTQVWMAENLSYAAEGSKCYDNEPANCRTYGRLYNWAEAKTSCPSGWHLPSDNEWVTLADYIGSGAGKKLKSKNYWDNNGNGTDEYGFSALPGGSGKSDGSFIMLGKYGYWWSIGEGTDAYYRYMSSEDDNISRLSSAKTGSFPIRCVKD